MTESKVEIITNTKLTLASETSEEGSRGFGRRHRLLRIWAAGFVFLALCLLFVDFRRLDHIAPKHGIHNSHTLDEARPGNLFGKTFPR
jgi:hypothetical protein